MREPILSVQNPKIKNVIKLMEKSIERKRQNLIVFEGYKELNRALHAKFNIVTVFLCESISGIKTIPGVEQSKVFPLTREVFNKIVYREDSDGFITVAEPRFFSLDKLKLSKNPFLVVLEGVEKPGNLGAILRTCLAARVDGVIICDPKTDIYNPNVIRTSIGGIFGIQPVACSNQEALTYLKQNHISVYASALTASTLYYEMDMKSSTAIVMGTEKYGLSDFWLSKADRQIKIPMQGMIDSLNVSVSAAILTFEAMRQRSAR